MKTHIQPCVICGIFTVYELYPGYYMCEKCQKEHIRKNKLQNTLARWGLKKELIERLMNSAS